MGFMGSTMGAVGGLGAGGGRSSLGRPAGGPFAGIGSPPPQPAFQPSQGTAGTGGPFNQPVHPFIQHLIQNPGLLQTLATQFGPKTPAFSGGGPGTPAGTI